MSEDVQTEDVQTSEETEQAAPSVAAAQTAGGTAETEDVLEALRDVVDPELGVNVVDLGLVYGVTLGGDGVATIDMTLTSAACPLTDVASTGCGSRRGAPTRSPRTAASSFAPSASTSDPVGARQL
jgi:hypothetical protein